MDVTWTKDGRDRSRNREQLWFTPTMHQVRAGSAAGRSDLPNHCTTRTAVHRGIMRSGVLAYPKITQLRPEPMHPHFFFFF